MPVDRVCRVCGSTTRCCHRAIVLGRHDVGYWFCDACGLLQTDEPTWLDEAYSAVIAQSDTGLLRRNVLLATRLAAVFALGWCGPGPYVDVGGGYGVMVRLMRDMGFDFRWRDPYCRNLLAPGHEAAPDLAATAVTAFEVMEHVADPLAFVRTHLVAHQCRTFICSTELFDGPPPQPTEWAYYSTATGQHLSFYQRRTLQAIGRSLGLRVYSHGYLHFFTDRALHPWLFAAVTSPVMAFTLPLWLVRRASLTLDDSSDALARVSAGFGTRPPV